MLAPGSVPESILVLDASGIGAFVAMVRGGAVVALQQTDATRGVAALLPAMMRDVLDAAGPPDRIAVVRGPGSFTGIRAALALAQGFGQAASLPVLGVTVADALAGTRPPLPGRTVWTAVDSRRDRVFLDRGTGFAAVPLAALPVPDGPVAVDGDAARDIAAILAARGADVLLLPQRRPSPDGVAAAARHLAEAGQPGPPHPLYVDAPEARQATPARPLPQPSPHPSQSA